MGDFVPSDPKVDFTVDVTPPWTLSTIQFGDDIINTVVTSIIVVFILANFNSMVHKLVSLSHRDHFSYSSFLRAYIFNASDDPVRIVSWMAGHNSFLPPHWNSVKTTRLWRRLFYPLLARAGVFIASIASIALALPGEREYDRCQSGDFVPVFITDAPFNGVEQVNSLCSEIKVHTRRGTTPTRLDICAQKLYALPKDVEEPSADSYVLLKYNVTSAELTTFFQSNGDKAGYRAYLQWRTDTNTYFRSLLVADDFTSAIHLQIVRHALKNITSDCSIEDGSTPSEDGYSFYRNINSCTFNAEVVAQKMDHAFRSALYWRQQPPGEEVQRVRAQFNGLFDETSECGYFVSVSRPIVNIVPLVIAWILVLTLNLAVGFTVADQGNVEDISFHFIKGILNVPICQNPLQTWKDDWKSEVPPLEFCEFRCQGGGVHGGFLIGDQDRQTSISVTEEVTQCTCEWRRPNTIKKEN